ncbi:MAG: ATP-binding protein [Rhodothermales bacterium]
MSVSTKKENGRFEIRIADNGKGIRADIKDRIFEPFFTTKPTGRSTGLGLSLSYDIVAQGHGGSIEAESSDHGGTTIIIMLPI